MKHSLPIPLHNMRLPLLIAVLTAVSVISFIYYGSSGLALVYNDARSHLNIGRRVVEGLTPGLPQIGSVWLPLTHFLMIGTIWNDFMWHSGLAGAIQSMIAFVATGGIIYLYLREIGVGVLSRLVAVSLFVLNVNVLYLQSTAMTELMLLLTMTMGAYRLLRWFKSDSLIYLIGAAFWVMLSTLVRYDGWFLCVFSTTLVFGYTWWVKNYREGEGKAILFFTLAGFGIFLWLLWNWLIFKDPLYFAFGPYSAHTQQSQLESAGILATKHNLWFSIKVYVYAMAYNIGVVPLVAGAVGALLLWFNKRFSPAIRIASVSLLAPLLFNIIALFLGHSVLFIEGLSGQSWFNVRYGIMMMPSIAIFVGYGLHVLPRVIKMPAAAGVITVALFALLYQEGVTILDAKYGSSQKNVSQVSAWLHAHVPDQEGLVLISAASHDAIIFSSGLPMKRFIHEGTGDWWRQATQTPDHWARWIVMRTYSEEDSTYRLIKDTPGLQYYTKVQAYPFADVYELKPQYLPRMSQKIAQGVQ